MTTSVLGGEQLQLAEDPEVQCEYCFRGVPFSDVRDIEICRPRYEQLVGYTCSRCREYLRGWWWYVKNSTRGLRVSMARVSFVPVTRKRFDQARQV